MTVAEGSPSSAHPWTPAEDLILLEGLIESFDEAPGGLIGPAMARLGRGQTDCLSRLDALVPGDQRPSDMRAVLERLRGGRVAA